MYNIDYRMVDNNWQSQERHVVVDSEIEAFMQAVYLMRQLLSTTEVELLLVGEMEYVIWAFGKCKGFLSIKQVNPKT